jgi:hypothetical protein
VWQSCISIPPLLQGFFTKKISALAMVAVKVPTVGIVPEVKSAETFQHGSPQKLPTAKSVCHVLLALV